jgi:hypothetical protein
MKRTQDRKRFSFPAFADIGALESKGTEKMQSTDIIPLGVYGLPCIGVLMLSLLKANAARITYAIVAFVLIGPAINYTTCFTNPGAMQPWSEIALLPFYRAIMGNWLAPLGGVFWFMVATYQLMVALLLLSKGKWVKLGLLGGILFFLGITPIMVMTFPSLIAAAGLAFLLTKDYNRSVLDMLRAKRHSGRAVA